ncbi:hypothetical protein [Luteimonas sp. MC1750]|uniref:hypothetical protein n=1 Tax=Luteimonas sp. MC1750 TaxID=2799326 RepID=UPI0018F0A0E7|nr:hypothetical protein [Luteimonas sp. MC1750]MBJ6984361.1 hypothetical protein [Luteimonas sp. MC1750]QQO05018.1 hypothetical protein JGR68_09020 [Luteimonas sp. MC1750]
MDRSDFAGSRGWVAGLLLMVACGTAPALAAQAVKPQAGAANTSQAVDEAAIKAELRRMVEQRKRELRPEYERRVRDDGKPSADRWLRETAHELGRRDRAEIRARFGY